MITDIYVSNELRKAYSDDLKMIEKGEKVLKINTLIWIKRLDKRILDFYGPIILDNHSTDELLKKIGSLLKEERIYILNDSFREIPRNLV